MPLHDKPDLDRDGNLVPLTDPCRKAPPSEEPDGASHRKESTLHVRAQFGEQPACATSVTGAARAEAEISHRLGIVGVSAFKTPFACASVRDSVVRPRLLEGGAEQLGIRAHRRYSVVCPKLCTLSPRVMCPFSVHSGGPQPSDCRATCWPRCKHTLPSRSTQIQSQQALTAAPLYPRQNPTAWTPLRPFPPSTTFTRIRSCDDDNERMHDVGP